MAKTNSTEGSADTALDTQAQVEATKAQEGAANEAAHSNLAETNESVGNTQLAQAGADDGDTAPVDYSSPMRSGAGDIPKPAVNERGGSGLGVV